MRKRINKKITEMLPGRVIKISSDYRNKEYRNYLCCRLRAHGMFNSISFNDDYSLIQLKAR